MNIQWKQIVISTIILTQLLIGVSILQARVLLSEPPHPDQSQALAPEKITAPSPIQRALSDFRVDNFITSSSKNVEITSRAALVLDGDLYVVWRDNRNNNQEIYLQRYDADGNSQWTADLYVSAYFTGTNQYAPVITHGRDASNQEWLYVAWYDYRSGNSDVYAQKISMNGSRDWSSDVRVNEENTAAQTNPDIAYGDDGSGTGYIFFVWEDERGGADDIYAQKYLPNGTSPWSSDQLVSAAANNQALPVLAMDVSLYRVYIAWQDYRNGSDWEIYAQKMNALNGTLLWSSDANITNDSNFQGDPEIALTSSGELYIAWESNQNVDTGRDIYTRLFSMPDTGPSAEWTSAIKANTDSGSHSQYEPTLSVDSSDDLYVVWEDWRSGDGRIYGQKLDHDSTLHQWPNDTSPADQLLTANAKPDTNQYDPAIALDAVNEYLFVVWEDYRNSPSYDDLYGQRCDLAGVTGWSVDQRINTDTGAVNTGQAPSLALSDDDQLYVAWADFRNGQSTDVFVQAYTSGGSRVLDANDVRLATDEYITSTYRYDPSIVIGPDDYLYGAWEDDIVSPDFDITSQKWPLDMSGNGVWGAPNEDWIFNRYTTGDLDSRNPLIVSSDTISEQVVYAVWLENRAGDVDLYMQKRFLNSSHATDWPADDLLVHDDDFSQYAHDAAVDAQGNVYVVWYDNSIGNYNIYARKITPEGTNAWDSARQINKGAGNSNYYNPEIAMDPNGEFFYVVWHDYRDGNANIYAQKLNLNGFPLWTEDVRVNRDESGYQFNPDVAVSAERYVYVVWEDWRNDDADIYAQLLNLNGQYEWDSDLRIDNSTDATSQTNPRITLLNSEDSFFVVWIDRRGGNRHIYAAKWGHQQDRLDHFTFANIADQEANQVFPITINAIDDQGSPIAITQTVSLADSTGTIHPTVANFDNQSAKTFSVTIGISATNVIITATAGEITGISNAFNVAAVSYNVYLPLVLRSEVLPPAFITEESEDNDDFASADGPLGSGTDCSGMIDDADDYFYFTATIAGSVSIELTGYTGDVWLQLYDTSQSLVDQSSTGSLSASISAGQYYVRIALPSGVSPNNSSYTLNATYP